jgi:SanA protein
MQRGVPEEDIQLDYAGLRTYDTCYRAQAIFNLESAVLVTQRFHLPRALFTCDQLGMKVVGVAADQRDYHPRSIAWSEMREVPATVMALVDVIRRRPPTFLGDPIPL